MSRAWAQMNPERVREIQRAYYMRHRSRLREKKREKLRQCRALVRKWWRRVTPTYVREQRAVERARRFHAAHPERARDYRRRRRARKITSDPHLIEELVTLTAAKAVLRNTKKKRRQK